MSSSPALCSAIALPEGTVPEWVHLLPAGAILTIDGRGPYTVRDMPALVAGSLGTGKLPLDVNHATDLAAPKGQPAPARGWIVELQQRVDGIWGRVEWTTIGRQMMQDREYRGISPVIQHDRSGAISAILRASLTNTPNLTGLTSLHSQEPSKPVRGHLDAADLEMIRKMGLDPQKYLAEKDGADAKERSGERIALQAAGKIDGDGLNQLDRDMIRMMGIDRSGYIAALSAERARR